MNVISDKEDLALFSSSFGFYIFLSFLHPQLSRLGVSSAPVQSLAFQTSGDFQKHMEACDEAVAGLSWGDSCMLSFHRARHLNAVLSKKTMCAHLPINQVFGGLLKLVQPCKPSFLEDFPPCHLCFLAPFTVVVWFVTCILWC